MGLPKHPTTLPLVPIPPTLCPYIFEETVLRVNRKPGTLDAHIASF